MKKIVKDYNLKKIEDLEKEKKTLTEEIARLKLELKVNPKKDTNILMKKRKKLAILLTVLNEKKILENLKK